MRKTDVLASVAYLTVLRGIVAFLASELRSRRAWSSQEYADVGGMTPRVACMLLQRE